MYRLVTVLLACLLAAPVLAGQNPDIEIYLDVDPPNYAHEIHPSASEVFPVYVCLDCFGQGGGTRGVAFLLVRTFQGFKLSQTGLLGGLDFGDAEVDGWTIAAGADCVYPDADDIVLVGVIEYLYLGVPGVLDVLPHPGTGRDVLDCNFESNYYCVHANLGVSEPPNPGEIDCYCPIPPPLTYVTCEPQGGDNPTHPPTYWYDVTPGVLGWPCHGFCVQVFDPDIEHYTNWVEPYAWTHADSVVQIGDELWVAWCDTTLEHGFWGGTHRFGFDHQGVPAWGHWRINGASMCDPDLHVLEVSENFGYLSDGYGYRVHAPTAVTPVESATWGTIKALYR